MAKAVVVSAINIIDGGPLTILKDALYSFNKLAGQRQIVFLLAYRGLVREEDYENLKFHYFPKSKRSWLYRLFYEYVYFYFFSLRIDVDSWLSLHDITPNVRAQKRYVYCHNASMFLQVSIRDFFVDPKQYLFSKLYKYLYKINIKKNSVVFVQQRWMAAEFSKIFELPNIIVAAPEVPEKKFLPPPVRNRREGNLKLFYPSYPRFFKNHKILFLASNFLTDVKFYLTISGNENSFCRNLQASAAPGRIVLLGRLSLPEVHSFYQECDALVFPSLLETWGLPISEIKPYGKPIIAADLPYAHETVGDYPFVYWFDPKKMESFIFAVQRFIDNDPYDKPKEIDNSFCKLIGWDSFTQFLLES